MLLNSAPAASSALVSCIAGVSTFTSSGCNYEDFNYSHIDWSTLEGNSHKDSAFVDCIMDSLLTQHVKEPTRDKNILDLVLTSDPGMVEELQVIEHLGSSDHNSLYEIADK